MQYADIKTYASSPPPPIKTVLGREPEVENFSKAGCIRLSWYTNSSNCELCVLPSVIRVWWREEKSTVWERTNRRIRSASRVAQMIYLSKTCFNDIHFLERRLRRNKNTPENHLNTNFRRKSFSEHKRSFGSLLLNGSFMVPVSVRWRHYFLFFTCYLSVFLERVT